ncbi:putative replicative DNA helicase [Acinetobacter phage XC1]|nr:putative replicative DNA helicase [Acinetobacter phage XC1]
MFYFKFHIGDYRRETSHLTLLEHGVYMTLMSTYYTNEQPLPTDEKQLFRLAGARTEEEKEAVLNVVNEFFKRMGSEWVHSRIDFELQKYHARAEINRENGKKGGRNTPKTQDEANENQLGSDFKQMGSESGSESEASEEQNRPLTNKPINQLTQNIEDVFLFWKNTFNKNDRTKLKGVRETKIRARLKEGYSVDEIKQAILNISSSQYHIDCGHTDIELICRDQSHLDRYIAMGGPVKLSQSPENKKQDLVEVEGLW